MGVLGLYKNGKKVEKIIFPVTRAGEVSEIKITLTNEHPARYTEIQGLEIKDANVIIEDIPRGLEPGKSAEITLKWQPQTESIDPLSTEVIFEEVIG